MPSNFTRAIPEIGIDQPALQETATALATCVHDVSRTLRSGLIWDACNVLVVEVRRDRLWCTLHNTFTFMYVDVHKSEKAKQHHLMTAAAAHYITFSHLCSRAWFFPFKPPQMGKSKA